MATQNDCYNTMCTNLFVLQPVYDPAKGCTCTNGCFSQCANNVHASLTTAVKNEAAVIGCC